MKTKRPSWRDAVAIRVDHGCNDSVWLVCAKDQSRRWKSVRKLIPRKNRRRLNRLVRHLEKEIERLEDGAETAK
jgi:hypothetical protein